MFDFSVVDVSTTPWVSFACCLTEANEIYIWGLHKGLIYLIPTHMPQLKSFMEAYSERNYLYIKGSKNLGK